MDYLYRRMANPDLQKSCTCQMSPCRCHFDFVGIYQESETLPSFLCKKEILKMHLEILYKSIGFLCEDKIISKLESYKLAKEQKRRDEEQRFQMQVQVKKTRGRSLTSNQGVHIPGTSTSLQSRRPANPSREKVQASALVKAHKKGDPHLFVGHLLYFLSTLVSCGPDTYNPRERHLPR